MSLAGLAHFGGEDKGQPVVLAMVAATTSHHADESNPGANGRTKAEGSRYPLLDTGVNQPLGGTTFTQTGDDSS